MRTWRWYSKLLVALVVAALGYWAWPTPWEHYKLAGANVRVNRITGHAQQLFFTQGWVDTRVVREYNRIVEERPETDADLALILAEHDAASDRTWQRELDHALSTHRWRTPLAGALCLLFGGASVVTLGRRRRRSPRPAP